MGRKRRFRWQGKEERSISELISEDGPLRPEAIYPIIRRLCVLLDSPGALPGRQLICPASVMVDLYGEPRILRREVSPAEAGAYLPPEQNRAELSGQSEKVYALGMLMLYMATGQVRKTEAEISLDKTGLLPLIRRCTAFDPMDRFEDLGALQKALKREMRAGKKVLPFMLVLLSAAALAALLFAAWQTGSARGVKAGDRAGYGSGYAEGYDRGFSAAAVVENEAAVDGRSGSLSGNYAFGEGPTAAYSEKDVFFLQDGDVFRMDAVTGQTELLKGGSGAYSIQYYQGFLYCCTPEHILRIDPVKFKTEEFCDSLGGRLYIFEDVFYLYDSADTHYLYRISDAGKTLTQISGAADYRCLNVVGGKLYYIDPDRGNGICCFDPDRGELTLISSSPYESFCIYEGKLYVGTDYGLIRMDLNGGNPEILSALPAASPNASDRGVFFLSGSGSTLEWMSADGRTRFTVVSSCTGAFQVAGKWILYRNEDDGGRLWKVRVSGADGQRAVQR